MHADVPGEQKTFLASYPCTASLLWMSPVGNFGVTLPTSPCTALWHEALGRVHGVQGYQEGCNAPQYAKKAIKSRNHMFYNHTPTPLWEATLVIYFLFLDPNNHIHGTQKN